MIHRRNILLGLGAAFAAPAIVKAESLMKVRSVREIDVIGYIERTIRPPLIDPLYGRSPILDILADFAAIDRAIIRTVLVPQEYMVASAPIGPGRERETAALLPVIRS